MKVADLIVVSKGMLACEHGVQPTGDKILILVLIRSGVGIESRETVSARHCLGLRYE